MSYMSVSASDRVDEAWEKSMLADLPPAVQQELRETAHEQEITRGQVVYRELAQPRYSFLLLVVTGRMRTFLSSPGGRRVATRYPRPGDLVGLTTVLNEGAAAGCDCLTNGVVLRLDPVTFRRLAKTDAAVGWATAKQVAAEINSVGSVRIPNMFGSVRVRVAWHLAELMTPAGDDRWVVHMSQQELAESVGSVREVVARVLAGLRAEGVLARDSRDIVVIDRDRLREAADSVDA
jgi:CRP/FNR family cyclic AMP-dependent transcriptional regulator